MAKAVNLSKKNVVDSLTSAGLAAAGFGAGQAILSKVNKPVAEFAGFAAGIALMTNEDKKIKQLGLGLSIVAGIRLVNKFSTPKDGAAPNSIQSMISKFVPNLNGLGQLGELGYTLAASPTVTYDTEGNIMGLEGIDGEDQILLGAGNDEVNGFDGFDGSEEALLGIEDMASSML